MRRLGYRLLPLALAAVAAPLMAPTCNGATGLHPFSPNTLILPMDECYQTDVAGPKPPATTCVGGNATGDDGALKAYGLVYFLLKHSITVYWVISPSKTAIDGIDMSLVATGDPVYKYSWSTGGSAPWLPAGTKRVDYRGGPFLIDGADRAKVNTLLQTDPDFAQFKTAQTIDIHESTTGFSAPVARSMNGLPPPLALLNITGGDNSNSVAVLQAYLTAAGLNFAGAGGTATGTRGLIYDSLVASDFLPDFPTSNLGKNGYKLLWVPHWVGPGSTYPDNAAALGTMTQAQLTQTLGAIGSFVDSGHDLFVECAGIGTFEGSWWPGSTPMGTDQYPTTSPTLLNTFMRFHTSAGLEVNSNGTSFYIPNPGPFSFAPVTSPFLQIGDFPYSSINGYVVDYKPRVATSSSYLASVMRLITASNGYDEFTLAPHRDGIATKGAVVYLAGHDYSTQSAGTRLVLNTLYNLGATCLDTNQPCKTGLAGVCADGIMKCVNGALTCQQLIQAAPNDVTCDGRDDDCNGLIDDGALPRSCYTGLPASTQNAGPCRAGQQVCSGGAYGFCQGEVKPSTEVCNGVDDDCDGLVDDNVAAQACYTGAVGTEGVGICRAGAQTCKTDGSGQFGSCLNQVLPTAPACNGLDNNCDGTPDNATACQCTNGASRSCYSGPTGTAGVGSCRAGTQTCANNQWGACVGEVVPSPEVCGSGADSNCNGIVGDACTICIKGSSRKCYDGAPGTENVGVCKGGTQSCDGLGWGACGGGITPGFEICDGKDNDCDGIPDNNAICPQGMACVNGNCVTSACGPGEIDPSCPEGYACQAKQCVASACGAFVCPAGQHCQQGSCVDPCSNVRCGTGSFCSGGACVAGGCYSRPCPSGQLCRQGACVADVCAAMSCPTGDFCRDGFCVQSCVFTHCAPGETCGTDGFCVVDTCAGLSCPAGQMCAGGSCAADACAGLRCPRGQVCKAGACVDDPCLAISCPAGSCIDGQCRRMDASVPSDSGSGNANGGTAGAPGAKDGCHCGSAEGSLPLWATAFILLGFTRGRRLRRVRGSLAPGRVTGGIALTAALSLLSLGCSGSSNPNKKGDSCQQGLTVCGSACVDLTGDTSHCGYCDIACAASEICDQGYCGPPGPVNPFLKSLSPSTGTQGTVIVVTVSGDRFSAGAELRVSLTGQPDKAQPARFVNSNTLVVDGFSLQALPEGAATVRVVNPGKLSSNGASFVVTNGSGGTPTLTTVTPNVVFAGGVVPLKLIGTNFGLGSVAHASGPMRADTGLATNYVGSTELGASLDLSAAVSGAYDIWVVNGGTAKSNHLLFTVNTVTPTLSSVSPTSAATGAKAKLVIMGSNYDLGSVAVFAGPGATSRSLNTTFVASNELISDLDLTGVPPGSYQLSVKNGSLTSGTATFTVTSNRPQLSQISPSRGRQGRSVSLTATGQAFDLTSAIHLSGPATPDTALSTTYASDTQVSATLDLSTRAAGDYLVDVVNSGGLTSNGLRFTVDSNQPALYAVTPLGGTQGAKVDLAFAGGNFESGAQVRLSGPGVVNVPLLGTTFVNVTTLTLSQFDATPYPADAYSFTVVNPGSAPSGAVPFTITPGIPAITQLSPASVPTNTVTTVTVTGSLFCKGSVVYVSSASLPSTQLPTAFVDASTLQIQSYNFSNIPPATYQVTVVNPGPRGSAAATFIVSP